MPTVLPGEIQRTAGFLRLTGISVDPALAALGFTIATFGSHVGLDLVNANDLLVDVTGADPAPNGQLVLDLSFSSPPPSVPEPATLALLGTGLCGLFVMRSKSSPIGRRRG